MTGHEGPALLVAIDTESDNQWDREARRNPTFVNTRALERLHDFFAQHRVRPTYVVTYPVARDAESAAALRRIVARGDAEIGAHHHAWETPPCEPADIDRTKCVHVSGGQYGEEFWIHRRPRARRTGPVHERG